MGRLPNELAVLSIAQRALSQAKTLKEVKELRDKAECARYYAQRARLGLEKQNQCAEFKLNCERKAGRLLMELGVMPGRPRKKSSRQANILADLGVNKSQSARWQQEARVPKELLELYVASTRTEGKEITAKGLIRLARQQRVMAMQCANGGAKPKRRPQFHGAITGQGQECLAGDSMAIVADLLNHHELLTESLREYCEQEFSHPRLVQRRTVSRILNESREWLKTLQDKLQDGSSAPWKMPGGRHDIRTGACLAAGAMAG
jgi:hypothetical protein